MSLDGEAILVSDLLDLIAGIGEGFASWRFYVCFVPSAVLGGLFAHYVSDQRLAVTLAAFSLVAGVISGLVWELRRS